MEHVPTFLGVSLAGQLSVALFQVLFEKGDHAEGQDSKSLRLGICLVTSRGLKVVYEVCRKCCFGVA